jgi:TolB-like protein
MPSHFAEKYISLALLLTLSGLSLGEASAASGYRRATQSLSHAAKTAGIEHIAVLPLSALDGASEHHGRIIAEELSIYLSRDVGAIGAVFASAYNAKSSLNEQPPGWTKSEIRKIAAHYDAGSVITGSFIDTGKKLHILIHLQRAGTSEILKTEKFELKKSRRQMSLPPTREEKVLPPAQVKKKKPFHVLTRSEHEEPASIEKTLKLKPSEVSELRDAPSSTLCRDSEKRIHALQTAILPYKARYWAHKTRKKKMDKDIVLASSSAIMRSSALAAKYDALFHTALKQKARALSPAETRLFIEMDGLAFEIHRRCRQPNAY